VREVLEELVTASFASVESLGRGLMRVQDVSDQVQRLANRSTLIAIQALAGTGDPATFGDELKSLAREVRDATDRTQRFAREIETAVAEADAHMREARERAIARLEARGPLEAPAATAGAPEGMAPVGADVRRLLERVLEMVQDASAKGERVSTASERASSVAERLARRLDGNASDAEALVVRLAPVGEPTPGAEPGTPDLRLVDDEEHDERSESRGEDARSEPRDNTRSESRENIKPDKPRDDADNNESRGNDAERRP
jgi:methyl-accepting chemotaxis protein